MRKSTSLQHKREKTLHPLKLKYKRHNEKASKSLFQIHKLLIRSPLFPNLLSIDQYCFTTLNGAAPFPASWYEEGAFLRSKRKN